MTGETSFPAFLDAAKTIADELTTMRSIFRDIANSLELMNDQLNKIANRV